MSGEDLALAARARAHYHADQALVCEQIEPWEHGSVLRCPRYPDYYQYNLVRVERDPRLDAVGLAAFADRALAGLAHRRVDVEPIDVAEALRGGFRQLGWSDTRIVWMHYRGSPFVERDRGVCEVPYDAVAGLRLAWHHEDFPEEGLGYLAQSRELALARTVSVFAILDRGEPIAFSQLERLGEVACVALVYVHPEHRGRGLGTAVTRAAIDAGAGAGELWISADEEDRAKDLYARLGFVAAWSMVEFTLAGARRAAAGRAVG